MERVGMEQEPISSIQIMVGHLGQMDCSFQIWDVGVKLTILQMILFMFCGWLHLQVLE